jgi:predicted enzyme related to lactoylglutathione lyase
LAAGLSLIHGHSHSGFTGYGNQDRMATFYQSAFGWQTQMFGEPMEIPGVGHSVSFTDTEGNRVSMLQPIPHNWHAS